MRAIAGVDHNLCEWTRYVGNATPSRPARSWMNCHATRPDRPPRVTYDHSTAAARSASWLIANPNAPA